MKIWKVLLVSVVSVFVLWLGIGWVVEKYTFWDSDEARGALAQVADLGDGPKVQYEDPFDKPIKKIAYLPQGWSAEDSLWFYQASQGSDLLPFGFFMTLEQKGDSGELFKSNSNINRYRYLPQRETFSNPDELPVGITKDTYQGKEYIGFTCAACHTSQINYKDIGIRIDGGPAASDMEGFLIDLAAALTETHDNDKKKQRFIKANLESGAYKTAKEVEDDLLYYTFRLNLYTAINSPVDCFSYLSGGSCNPLGNTSHYGYSRLDAFGRIYNRVLQHILSSEQLRTILSEKLPDSIWASAEADIEKVLTDKDQLNLVVRSLMALKKHMPQDEHISEDIFRSLRNEMFNPANAPASYPFLWDIPQHDYVQWTGLVSNGGLGPLGRNVGQVIGVFGTLDWQTKPSWSINSVIGGQGFGDTHVDFRSSIDKRNLRRVEEQLGKLMSPQWPDELFSEEDKLDMALVNKGQPLFDQYCASCHLNINRQDPDRRIIAHMGNVDSVKTDDVLAKNSVGYGGYTGILKDKYVDLGLGKVVLLDESPVASLVNLSSRNVVTTWDPDKWKVQTAAEWLFDMARTLLDNKVKTTLKQGDYNPATTNNPFAPLYSYKARALNGIWATAPYMHNGSIPSLYHMLLPKKDGTSEEYIDAYTARCEEDIEYRPDSFVVGSREFMTDMVGFRYEDYDGFVFDTSLSGNSNSGHEYAAGKTKQLNGEILPALCSEDRKALLEYLKSL